MSCDFMLYLHFHLINSCLLTHVSHCLLNLATYVVVNYAKHTSDKGVRSGLYKDYSKLNSNKPNNPLLKVDK